MLFERVAVPVAKPGTPGAWIRDWRVMALDGVMLDVPDTPENLQYYGKPEGGAPGDPSLGSTRPRRVDGKHDTDPVTEEKYWVDRFDTALVDLGGLGGWRFRSRLAVRCREVDGHGSSAGLRPGQAKGRMHLSGL